MKTNNLIEAGAPANVRPSSVEKYKITLLNRDTGEARSDIITVNNFKMAWRKAELWKNVFNELDKTRSWKIARIEVVL